MRPLLEMLLVVVALATTRTSGLPYGELPPQLQAQEGLVWYGDDRAGQGQSNVYPSYKQNILPEQIGQARYTWDQSQQDDTFQGYESHVPSRNSPDYIYQSQQTLQADSNVLDGLTITCNGRNKVCVAKSLCVDGYVHPLKQGFTRPGQVRECRLSHEACCTLQYDLNGSPYGNDQINALLKDNRFPEPTLENDQRYVQYGQNNQADVAGIELTPPLKNDAELQSASNDGFAIEATANQPHHDANPAEDLPVDYNQIPADTNQREQYQTGGASASEPVFPPLKPAPTNVNPASVFQFPVQSGCAAALLCVEEQYCTLEGVISKEPVGLTSQQLLQRVPLSSCRNKETGIIGKCCRDPNYVDPWPTGNLPANYTGGFDEQGFPTFLNITKVRPPSKKPVTQPPTKIIPKPPVPIIHEQQEPTHIVPEHSVTPHFVVPIPTQLPPLNTPPSFVKRPYETASSDQHAVPIVPELPRPSCGVRNYGQRPPGFRDTDAAFGEIPWQAMVLWSEERKILCSGALVAENVVMTAASCVNRFSPNEISVKLGEWKLGYELEQEEPLPFQIVNVQNIKYHPGYVEGLSNNDTAMLFLQRPAAFNLHINTLCLPDDYQIQATSQCIVTGWGKSILQSHYAGAIMHMVDVDLLSRDVCQNRVLGAESHVNVAGNVICGKPQNENNMCQADVGAPLACYDGNGAYRIAGIYSQDTGCLSTNQVAMFAPIDVTWVKRTMYPSESTLEAAQTSIDDGYDYRKSNLPAGNQYLPPV